MFDKIKGAPSVAPFLIAMTPAAIRQF